VQNLALIFDRSRFWSALVSKGSRLARRRAAFKLQCIAVATFPVEFRIRNLAWYLFRAVAAVKATTVILTCICNKLSQHANSVWRTAVVFDVCEGAQHFVCYTTFTVHVWSHSRVSWEFYYLCAGYSVRSWYSFSDVCRSACQSRCLCVSVRIKTEKLLIRNQCNLVG